MRRTIFTDPFYYRQPGMDFIEQLKKPVHEAKPQYYGTRQLCPGEVDVHGLYIRSFFPKDPEQLLETIYTDFRCFTTVYEIHQGEDCFPVDLLLGQTACFEAYRIEVSQRRITITAADTEGIRRGLIFLEDQLRRSEAAYLLPGIISRKPHIRSRITRCFFSPINRPPKNGDELTDNIDYYPEEYLNRLMHDGANGVFIYTRFSDILPSSIITEYGDGYEQRMEKLNRVIAKCRRYGIGVYIFAIEPYALTPELAEKYPDMVSDKAWNQHFHFCCSSERGKAYCKEAGRLLLELAPNLRGLITVPHGERPSSCVSDTRGKTITYGNPSNIVCPRCSRLSNGQVLALVMEALRAGAREVNPDFETVSYTYGHRSWDTEDILEYVEHVPDDVIPLQCFDDMGYAEQLGKLRQSVDYWLSYAGPSQLFTKTAEKARECGKHMFAKMQVCCSHEIATVPFIPVPGLLFEKYQGAHAYGVEGILQCWYFGNYPSMMSKAAGELSFIEDFSDKTAFLESLAGIYYGRSRASAVAKAWSLFEEGYVNYPLNIMFSYYGPMHDGIVWELALKPKNFAPARTWQLPDPVDGDRIYDALLAGHTLEEACILCDRMRTLCNQGAEELMAITPACADEREQLAVAQAVALLFDSGTNILEFYRLRDELGKQTVDPVDTLTRMRKLVILEIKNSQAMIPLCESCPSLGYHSEAEGFKFFPEKLRHRIFQLQTLLETEFPEVAQRVQSGLAPLAYYEGEEEHPGLKRYRMRKGSIEQVPWEPIGENGIHQFRMSYNDKKIFLELESQQPVKFYLCPEFRLMHPDVQVDFGPGGLLPFNSTHYLFEQMFGQNLESERAKYRNCQILPGAGTHLLLTLDQKELGMDRMRPMKMKIMAGGDYWTKELPRPITDVTIPRINLGRYNQIAEDYGWILPEA